MKYVTFGDLRLGLRDFFDNKAELAATAVAFRIYADPLREKLQIFESLHRAVGGKPLVSELADVERVHDLNGRAFFFVCKGVLALETLDASVRTVLTEIMAKMVPSLGSLAVSYEDEAAGAAEKRKVLDAHSEFLATFPVGQQHTLLSMLTAHVTAAEQLEEILARRADETAAELGARTRQINTLRGTTVGLLNRFRQGVVDEVAVNPALPRDLEARIFNYFDQMEANRGARHGRPAATEEAPLT